MKVEFKEKGISGIEDVPEYLNFFGYTNARLISGNTYEVDSLGIDVPSVTVVGITDNPYGKAIESLRNERGLSASALANIMLVSEGKILAVEQGKSWFTDTELNMCANVFGVSPNALKFGDIVPRLMTVDEKLAEVRNKISDAIKSQNDLLKIIQEFDKPNRYTAEVYGNVPDVSIGFAIYDSINDDYVRNDAGAVVLYDTARDALIEARNLEGKTVSEPSENEKAFMTEDEIQEGIDATFSRAFGYDYKEEWKEEAGPEFDENEDIEDTVDDDFDDTVELDDEAEDIDNPGKLSM